MNETASARTSGGVKTECNSRCQVRVQKVAEYPFLTDRYLSYRMGCTQVLKPVVAHCLSTVVCELCEVAEFHSSTRTSCALRTLDGRSVKYIYLQTESQFSTRLAYAHSCWQHRLVASYSVLSHLYYSWQ